jgi:branched-subunit amino acid transport protein
MRSVLLYLSRFVFIRYYDRMKIRSSIFAMLLFLPLAVLAEPRVFLLELEEWSRPRSGQFVASLPAVRDAVAVWESNQNAQIQIRYPVGESGNLWAQELSDWLIALGIEAGSIDIVTGSIPQDRVEIALLGVGGKE